MHVMLMVGYALAPEMFHGWRERISIQPVLGALRLQRCARCSATRTQALKR